MKLLLDVVLWDQSSEGSGSIRVSYVLDTGKPCNFPRNSFYTAADCMHARLESCDSKVAAACGTAAFAAVRPCCRCLITSYVEDIYLQGVHDAMQHALRNWPLFDR